MGSAARKDTHMSEESEIVDLDQCPTKQAIRIGGAIAFALTLFPMTVMLGCLPLILAGFAATASYVFEYRIRLELKVGMKVAMLACMAGFALSTLVYDALWLAFDYRIGMDTYLEFIRGLQEASPEETREKFQEGIDEMQNQAFGFGTIVSQIVTILVCSGIGGALGGALATAIFKKGPLAQ